MKSKIKIVEIKGQFPSEFISEKDIYDFFSNHNLVMGRMISGSKSGYMQENPDHQVIFNANIITKLRGKCWYGDLDITEDFDNLKNVADALNEDLYILYEHDARWGAENEPIKSLMKKAKIVIMSKNKM